MPTAIRVELNAHALRRIGASTAGRLVSTVTRRTLNRAKVLCPVDTGNLRNSQTMELRTLGEQVIGRVSTWVKYAWPVHEGVNHPVVIVPKRKKALRFMVGGRVVYATKVTIPPRRGRPWLRRALTEVAVPAGFVVIPR